MLRFETTANVSMRASALASQPTASSSRAPCARDG